MNESIPLHQCHFRTLPEYSHHPAPVIDNLLSHQHQTLHQLTTMNRDHIPVECVRSNDGRTLLSPSLSFNIHPPTIILDSGSTRSLNLRLDGPRPQPEHAMQITSRLANVPAIASLMTNNTACYSVNIHPLYQFAQLPGPAQTSHIRS
jgi:hypothetical protein